MKSFILLSSLIFLHVHGQKLKCPNGYTMVLEKCLKAFPAPTESNHLAAEKICRKDGGTLANIRSVIENRATSVFASNNNLDKFWIGTFCFRNDTLKCVYDDYSGSISNYNSFAAGNPVVTGNGDGCVYMLATGAQTGRWISSKCETTEAVGTVCEVPAYVDNPEYLHNSECQYFDGYCYIRRSGSITQMSSTCSQIKGLPLSIRSKRENDFVVNLGSVYTYTLLGATRVSLDKANIKYAWMDGTGWDEYNNIDMAHDIYETQKCLIVDRSTGLWKAVNCDDSYVYYCKVPLPPNPTIDISNCNSTLLMAPAVITSYGYPNNHNPAPCTWKIATVGAYQLRIAFTDAYNSIVTVYDGDGNKIGDATPHTSIVLPSNYITVVQSGGGPFYASILPY